MTIALIRIGQRIVKHEDFESAYIADPEVDKGHPCEIRVRFVNGKTMPAFFGSYNDCNCELDKVSMIIYNNYSFLDEEDLNEEA